MARSVVDGGDGLVLEGVIRDVIKPHYGESKRPFAGGQPGFERQFFTHSCFADLPLLFTFEGLI
jgi:hypothetical protein